MPLFTVKEIGEMCGIVPKNIHTYICRGKLIKRKDGLIDDNNKINIEFLSKYNSNYVVEQVFVKVDKPIQIKKKELPVNENQLPEKEESIIEKKKEEIIVKQERKKRGRSKPKEDSKYDLSNFIGNNILNQLKAKKLIEETELLKIKRERETGKLISFELAKNIFNIHITNIVQELKNMADNYTSDLCSRLYADRNILAEFRGKLITVLNESAKNAFKKSERDLKNITENQDNEQL